MTRTDGQMALGAMLLAALAANAWMSWPGRGGLWAGGPVGLVVACALNPVAVLVAGWIGGRARLRVWALAIPLGVFALRVGSLLCWAVQYKGLTVALDYAGRLLQPRDLVYWGGLTVLFAIGDRAGRRGRHRPGACQHCGYLLRGLPTRRCPECGREFDPAELEGS